MNIPLDQWSGAEATKELHATMVRQHKEATKQSKKVIILIVLILAVAVLTLLLQLRLYL